MFPVLLPTETINRELDYQLFLAVHLAARGATTFVGRADAVYDAGRYLEGGLLVGKAFEPFFPHTDLGAYRGLKRRGFVVVHLDEEGAIFPGRRDDWKTALARRLDVHAIAKDDFVCTWGPFQEDFYRSLGAEQTVRVTGHPRFDLYRPSHRAYFDGPVSALRARFGDFFLLNTNLSTANNGLGLRHSFTKRFLYDPSVPAKRWEALRFWMHTSRILLNFVELLHRLSDEFPKMSVVLRPHPSESIEYYRIVTSGLPNVHVLHEGSVAPWILASRALIHDGCTTGVEAFLGDVPVVNYKSVSDDRYDMLLPNAYGTRCGTPDEVVAELKRVLAGGAAPRAPEVVAEHAELMINLREEAMPRLLATIDEARERLRRPSYRRLPHRVHARITGGADVVKHGLRQLSPVRRVTSAYARQKFYGMRAAGLADRLARIASVVPHRVACTTLSDALVQIEPCA